VKVAAAKLQPIGKKDADAAKAKRHAEEPLRQQRLQPKEPRQEQGEKRTAGADDRRGPPGERLLRKVHAGVAEPIY
jgi:hypothetical protein